ncbi:MAG: hypothetical protein ABGY95_06740 [Rubritalea sp.]|uniref:hypothetical protein n=1 Tax=Rubritalea sp. TaxID=2109375 RepID=UPI0032420A41
MKCILFGLPVLFVSCSSNESATSGLWRKSPGVWVNGAEVFSNVEAMNGAGMIEKDKFIYMAATQNFDGPLRWQILADGTQGEHLTMRVEGVQVSTSRTKRSVKIPSSMLGGENHFVLEQLPKPKRSLKKKAKAKLGSDAAHSAKHSRWMASYTIPDSLHLYPKADGKVVVAAKIVVTTANGSQSEWVNFALLPNSNKSKSFTFRQTLVEYDGVPIE